MTMLNIQEFNEVVININQLYGPLVENFDEESVIL